MGNGIDLLRGGTHFLNGLGAGTDFLHQLEELQELQLLHELGDSFQRAAGGISPNMLASMLQNGSIAGPLMMPGPNMGNCNCPHNYAMPQMVDFGASPAPSFSAASLYQRAQGSMFERFLKSNPFARQQVEMAMGGRIMPDGVDDGRMAIMPFGNGHFPAGGAQNNSFAQAAQIFAQMGRGGSPLDQLTGGGHSQFHGMMLNALSSLFGSMGQGQVTQQAGSAIQSVNGQSPFVDWFGPPGNPQLNGQGQGAGFNANGPFQPGQVGQNQEQFGLSESDGSDISGVLNDKSLTVEDKVTLMIMLIMQKMDKDIEKQAQEINKLQQQQSKQGGGGGGGKGGGKGGGGGGGGSDKSIDVETMKLKRLIDKRSQMFDMLRQIIDKYNQTAKGIIDSMR
jgi:hypothetical protein